MNGHERCLDLAITCIDFALSPVDEALVNAHLASCSDCRTQLEAIRADSQHLADAARELAVSPAVRDTVLDAALENAVPSQLGRPLLVLALVALLVALAGTTVVVGARLLEMIEDARRPVPIVTASPTPQPAPTSRPTTPVVRRGTDAIGDAGNGPDIVAIQTTVSQDTLELVVELLDPFEVGEVFVRLRNSLGEGEDPVAPECGPWSEDAGLTVTPERAVLGQGRSWHLGEPTPEPIPPPAELPFTIENNTVTVTVPLALIPASDTLYLAVWTYGAGNDHYPKAITDDDAYLECFAALLPGEASATDPTGDGEADIVAMTTSSVNDNVIFEVEFAEDYVASESHLSIDIADPAFVTDGDCFMSTRYQILMARGIPQLESPGVQAGLYTVGGNTALDVTPLRYTVNGSHVTIGVPLALIGSPEFINFTATAQPTGASTGGMDNFPDWSSADPAIHPCHQVTLRAESPPPSASPSPRPTRSPTPTASPSLLAIAVTSSSDPWPTVVPLVLLLAIAAILAYGQMARREARADRRRSPGATLQPFARHNLHDRQ